MNRLRRLMRWPDGRGGTVRLVRAGLVVGLLPSLVLAGPVALTGGGGSASSAGFSALVTIGQSGGEATGTGFRSGVGFVTALDVAGPTGAVQALAVAENANGVVTATLTDDVDVLSATLFFRAGGAAAFSSLPMTEGPPGTWTAAIPAANVTEKGVQCFVEASDGANVSRVPAGAPSAGTANIPVTVASRQVFSLPASTYVLLGVPIAPASGVPTAVFDELGAYDTHNWRYGTFDPATASYREHPDAANAVPGQGFWVISRNAANINVNGTSTEIGHDFDITLSPGFNQIANPFAFAVDFSNVVRPAAVEANLIARVGNAYVPNQTTLQPSTGYWIRNNGTSSEVISIRPLGAGVLPGREAAPALSAARQESGWRIVARADVGEFSDGENRFGMRPDATPGRDAIDFADAPAPPEGYVLLSFEGPGGLPLLNDFRGMEVEGAEWRMVLTSDQAGAPFRITLSRELALPAGWELGVFESESGRRVALAEDGSLSGVLGSGVTRRSWVILAGTAEYVGRRAQLIGTTITAIELGPGFPNPAPKGGAVSFEVRIPDRVDGALCIHDLQGREVRVLHRGTLEPGIHRITWDRADASGRGVAAGVYFARLTAGGTHQQRKVLVIP